MNNIDFSNALQNAFTSFGSLSQPNTVRLALENYTPNAQGQGFRMSYMLESSFTNRSPKSTDGAPIRMSIVYSQPLSEMKEVGAIQTQAVRIENMSLKA
jgi:hypothetical protein